MKALVIGDPHFKHNTDVSESEEYVENILKIASKYSPTFIVLLGDILDTHEIVRVQPHNLAEKFIEGLSDIAHTYVLIGNHDYINNSQFLTTNHIFGPFKKWSNLTIVDQTIGVHIEERYFVFVPYVPVGRFQEALDTIVKDGETWEFADCIFAHQEFKGCKPRNKDNTFKSKVGDVWNEDYPLIISGHIHKAQNVGNNIKYPGNSQQHSYLENANKSVWIVEWLEDTDDEIMTEPKITKISTGIKKKKAIDMNASDIKDKLVSDFDEYGSYHLQINLAGTTAEFNNFKSSKLYSSLVSNGVIFSYDLKTAQNIKTPNAVLSGASRSDVSYSKVFHGLVSAKNSPLVKQQYEKLFGPLEDVEEDCIEINYVEEHSSEVSNDIIIHSICKGCENAECEITCLTCGEMYCETCKVYVCNKCETCSECDTGKLVKYKGNPILCVKCKKGKK